MREGNKIPGKHSMPLRLILALAAAGVVGAFFLREHLLALEAEEAKGSNGIIYAEPVPEDHPGLLYYEEQVPGREIILACEDDLTDDGQADLVVIYHNPEEGRKNWMVALINQGDGIYTITEPTPPLLRTRPSVFSRWTRSRRWNLCSPGRRTGRSAMPSTA